MDNYCSVVEACRYVDVNNGVRVFNYQSLEYFLFVHLPREFVDANYELYQLDEIHPNAQMLNTCGCVTREGVRPWIRIVFALLNRDIGYHLYKLSFVNKVTNDVYPLYFAYNIQSDKPDKPYVYMER